MMTPRLTRKHVLLIDADAATRETLTTSLHSAGFSTLTASNGQEALTLLRQSPALPALILLDPPTLGPQERDFREQRLGDPHLATIPVVVLAPEGEPSACADLPGAVAYVPKPVEPEGLLEAMTRILIGRQPEILVVEDEDGVRRLLATVLPEYGFRVHLGENREALRLFEAHRDTIDLILLDVQMPGLDGPEIMAALRACGARVPVVYMTGSSGKYTSQELLDSGAACVLNKPFASMGELARVLRQVALAKPTD
jgi:CheY-like chemotaxis protein